MLYWIESIRNKNMIIEFSYFGRIHSKSDIPVMFLNTVLPLLIYKFLCQHNRFEHLKLKYVKLKFIKYFCEFFLLNNIEKVVLKKFNN